MGVADVETFLSMLANERKASASTHNQALSALLFLYREVLGFDLSWLNNIGRPQQSKRSPAVLTKEEVAGLLAQWDGWTLTADRRGLWCPLTTSSKETKFKPKFNPKLNPQNTVQP